MCQSSSVCLLIINANIHYVLQKTVVELNEILYFSYYQGCSDHPMIMVDGNDYGMNLEIDGDELGDILDYYQTEYDIGSNYNEINQD